MTKMKLSEWSIRVEGRVQGVGFRAAVQKLAMIHSVAGYVRNSADGSVEICAQGSEENLQTFLESLQNRPGRSSVDKVEIQKTCPSEKYSSFSIR
jgi:acylphosphatase